MRGALAQRGWGVRPGWALGIPHCPQVTKS